MERPLGSDHLGRDVLSRVIVGSRTSLYVAVLAVSISKLIGFSWGILTGYTGGKFDLISQRFLDILMSFPGIILAMLLLVGVGSGLYTVIAAIAITGVAGTTRVIRSVTLSIREMEYVEAGRALGASPLRIMFVHITPQCIAPLMVLASVSLGGAIFRRGRAKLLGSWHTAAQSKPWQHAGRCAGRRLQTSMVACLLSRHNHHTDDSRLQHLRRRHA